MSALTQRIRRSHHAPPMPPPPAIPTRAFAPLIALSFAALHLAPPAAAAPPAPLVLARDRVPLPTPMLGATWSLALDAPVGVVGLVRAATTLRLEVRPPQRHARVVPTDDRVLYQDAAGAAQLMTATGVRTAWVEGAWVARAPIVGADGRPLAAIIAALGLPDGGVAVVDAPSQSGPARLVVERGGSVTERDLGPLSDLALLSGAGSEPLVIAGVLDLGRPVLPHAGHLVLSLASELTPISTASPNTYRALAAVGGAAGGIYAAFMHPLSGLHVATTEPREPGASERVVPATSPSPVPSCETLRAAGGRGVRATTAAANGLGLFRLGGAATVYLARLEHRAHFVGRRFRMPPDTCAAAGHRDCFMARRALTCEVHDRGATAVVVSRIGPAGPGAPDGPGGIVDCWRADTGDVASDALAVATDGARVVLGWLRPRPRNQSEATILTLDGQALARACARR